MANVAVDTVHVDQTVANGAPALGNLTRPSSGQIWPRGTMQIAPN